MEWLLSSVSNKNNIPDQSWRELPVRIPLPSGRWWAGNQHDRLSHVQGFLSHLDSNSSNNRVNPLEGWPFISLQFPRPKWTRELVLSNEILYLRHSESGHRGLGRLVIGLGAARYCTSVKSIFQHVHERANKLVCREKRMKWVCRTKGKGEIVHPARGREAPLKMFWDNPACLWIIYL